MATTGFIEALTGPLDQIQRRVFRAIFEYVLRNLRIGRADHGAPSENLQAYFFSATTPSTADEEFSIAHNLGRAPYLVLPVLPLDAVNSRLVPLKVSRAADTVRIYLSSPETDASVWVLVEV